MKKLLSAGILLLLPVLSGCGPIGEKAASMTVIYCITAVLSILLLAGCFGMRTRKNRWLLVLFCSVAIVNIGYLCLSVSRNLSQALFANRLAYLGSVFLPMSMWMIILKVTRIRISKWLPAVLLCIGVLVFLVAASPGYLDIYYKEVTFQHINGVGVLQKVYGPWHSLYLIYLLGYFAAMVISIIHATVADKIESSSYAAVLAAAVFVNIGVWLVEQLVEIPFEILSVSYIISELFLLGLHMVLTEQARQKPPAPTVPDAPPPAPDAPPPVQAEAPPMPPASQTLFVQGMEELTPTERIIFDCYIAGRTTQEILEQLNIKENTLKFHNKNIYSKLGVSSRKQLRQTYRQLDAVSPGSQP